MAQNFNGTKLWWIAANKHFGAQNSYGGLAALRCKVAMYVARIKIVGGNNFGGMVANRQIHQFSTAKVFCYMVIYVARFLGHCL